MARSWRRSRTDRGFTLVEVILAIVLSGMVAGVVVAALFTSQNVAKSTTAQINASADAGLISSFLFRDAQSAGGIIPTTGKPSTLGVSTTGDTGGWNCTPAPSSTPTIRFSWTEYAPSTSSIVVLYTFDTPTQSLTRQSCNLTTGVSGAKVLLSSHLGSVAAACVPVTTPVCTRPTSVSLTVNGSGAQASFASTLTASLRVAGLQLAISGPATLPGGQINIAYTATPLITVGYTAGVSGVSAAWTATGLPPGMTVDPSTGVLAGTPTAAASYTPVAKITVTDSITGKVTSASKTFSSFAIGAALTTTFPTLPTTGQVNIGYTSNAGLVSGGVAPYTWALASGTLPAGVAIDAATGTVSGTPTATGTFAPVIKVTDVNLLTATSAPYAINIAAPPTITLPATLPNGQVGVAYASTTMVVAGGTSPYTWSVSSGALPAGVSIAPSTGVISGTPSATGSFSPVIMVTDSLGATDTQGYTFTVTAALSISGPATLPNGDVGLAYSSTMVATGGTSPYTWSVLSGALPTGVTMAPTTGVISGTPNATGTFSPVIKVTDSLGVTATKSYTVVVKAAPVVSGPATLPGGQVGLVYTSTTMVVTGGTSAYTWSVLSGALPAGVALDPATGVISGTPTASGSFTPVIKVIDSLGASATKTYAAFVIKAAPSITAPAALPNGDVGLAYSSTMVATGGTTPYTWSVSSGALPTGVTMAPTTGVISGAPNATGTFSPVISVTDSLGATATKSYTVIVSAAPVVALPATLPNGQVSIAYTSTTMTVTGGTSAFTWSVLSGAFPAGVTMAPTTGVISGTPTAAGTFSPVIKVTDSLGATATKSYTFTINAVPVVSGPATLPGGQIGIVYTSTTMVVTGGTSAYTWSLFGGALPAGVTLNTTTGVISGTPTATGSFAPVIKVIDSLGASATKTYATFVIKAAPSITAPATLPNGDVGLAYTSTMVVTGGSTAYTWSVSSGALPTGVTIAPTTGVISGTPTAVGTFSPVINVTDSVGATATKSYTVVIKAAPTITAPATLPNGQVAKAYTSTTMVVTGGTSAFTWSVLSGALPAGVTMAPTTGVISGTPTASGTFSPVIKVTDSLGGSDTEPYTFTINAIPVITAPAALPAGQMAVPYTSTMVVTGGTSAYTWSVSAGALPTGVTIAPTTGVISGTPTAAGTFSPTIRVVDSLGAISTKAYTVTVTTRLVVSLPASLPSGQVAVAYASTTMTGTGGTAPYSWTATDLPDGLTISTAGVISGTPTASGNFPSVVVTATDASSFTATKTYSLVITSELLISTADLPDGQVGVAYTSTTMTRTGGQSPYTWTATGLPAGVTMTTAGVLSGTPTAAGSFTPNIKVTDAVTNTTTVYTVTINAALAITGPTLPDGQVGLPYTSTTMVRTGGTAPYTWSATNMPPGLSIGATTGVISGAPSTQNTYNNITIRVTDALGTSAQVVDTVVIAAAAGGCPAVQDSWTGQYYNNITLSGTPVLTRIDPFLTFNWGTGSAGPGVNTDNFSVRWTRAADLSAGTYQIVLNTEDGGRLYVDGVLKLDKWNEHAYPGTPTTVNVPLTQGSHTFVVEYFNVSGLARADLDATLPGNEVSAGPRSCGDKRYFGQNQITLATSAQITAMSLTIKVAQTAGVVYSDNFQTVQDGRVTEGHTTSGGFVTYTFTLVSGQRIDAGVWTLAAQYAGNGTLHATSGDTWTLTTTTSTGTRTVSGGF